MQTITDIFLFLPSFVSFLSPSLFMFVFVCLSSSIESIFIVNFPCHILGATQPTSTSNECLNPPIDRRQW